MKEKRTFIAIDLKSFYASVECVEAGIDPLTSNLVVADESRTAKTICLAVSPSLKAHGISGRARLFEVIQRVKEVNEERRRKAPGGKFHGKSWKAKELEEDPGLELDYLVAEPRMAYYIEYSTKIYEIYLKYVAPEDIHVYSIDEVFIDATKYLKLMKMSAHELAMTMIRDVLYNTGITATAGIGPNLYLCKVAMDIVAKHIPADRDGVRIAEIDEISYRELLWDHQPLTDFWRVGGGISRRLAKYGIYTMGDLALYSIDHEDDLFKEFGINAELLIDHAWGYEPCRMEDIKSYLPNSNSLSNGQVLKEPYSFEKGKVIVREMAYSLSLDLVDKGLVTDHVSLYIGYDSSSADEYYRGERTKDFYGRIAPKPAHSSLPLGRFTSSETIISAALVKIYEKIVDPGLTIRRINICADRVLTKKTASSITMVEQTDLFRDHEEEERRRKKEEKTIEKDEKTMEAILQIKSRFGKNAVFKGLNLEEGATGLERNKQIGGHKE
ncbi:MAG: DNA methylase [Erysipelotrichaceae bacterium]|nr:DNA methylase [Erysipelotrichaceae bacterium]